MKGDRQVMKGGIEINNRRKEKVAVIEAGD